MWGHNMKNQAGSKTLDHAQLQKKLKNTNAGKSESIKSEEILKIMTTLKDSKSMP